MAIPAGVYRLALLGDPDWVIGVDNDSYKDWSWLTINDWHHEHYQKWVVKPEGDWYIFSNTDCDKLMATEKRGAFNKNWMILWHYDKGNWSRFKINPSGTNAVINNNQYPSYYFQIQSGTNYIVTPWTWKSWSWREWLTLWKKSGTAANKRWETWCLIKDSNRDYNLGTPASPSLGYVTTLSSPVSDFGSWSPTWIGSGSEWQVRYRYRCRKKGTDTFTGWSYWYSLDNKTTDEGWGNAWAANTPVTTSGSWKIATKEISVTLDKNLYDKKEYQVEVRRFMSNAYYVQGVPVHTHSPSAIGTVNFIVCPDITIGKIGYNNDGLVFTVTSDFLRNGNSATFESIKLNGRVVATNYSVSNLGYNKAKVTIPNSNLKFIPTGTGDVSIDMSYRTIDGSFHFSGLTTTFDADSYGVPINPTITKGSGGIEYVNVGNFKTASVILQHEQDGRASFITCEKVGNNFVVIPPFGKEYILLISVTDSAGNEGFKRVRRDGSDEKPRLIFNFGNDFAQIPYDVKVNRSLKRDTAVYQTQDRQFESEFFGEGSSREFSITGRIKKVDKMFEKASYNDIERLSMCGYSIMRTADGGLFKVAISRVDFESEDSNYRNVVMSCREVS